MPRDLRTNRLQMLLTAEEREHFEAAANAEGVSLSAWLRAAGREKILRAEGQRPGLMPGGKRRAK